MKRVRSCPRCEKSTLVSTGAFWACSTCGFAITHAALCFDDGRTSFREEQEEVLQATEPTVSTT